jgi:hypothetical protein
MFLLVKIIHITIPLLLIQLIVYVLFLVFLFDFKAYSGSMVFDKKKTLVLI